MSNVLSFNDKLAERKKEKEAAELMEFFTGDILPNLTDSEKLDLLDALDRKDSEKYFAITEPIIRHNVMKEFGGIEGGRK